MHHIRGWDGQVSPLTLFFFFRPIYFPTVNAATAAKVSKANDRCDEKKDVEREFSRLASVKTLPSSTERIAALAWCSVRRGGAEDPLVRCASAMVTAVDVSV